MGLRDCLVKQAVDTALKRTMPGASCSIVEVLRVAYWKIEGLPIAASRREEKRRKVPVVEVIQSKEKIREEGASRRSETLAST